MKTYVTIDKFQKTKERKDETAEGFVRVSRQFIPEEDPCWILPVDENQIKHQAYIDIIKELIELTDGKKCSELNYFFVVEALMNKFNIKFSDIKIN